MDYTYGGYGYNSSAAALGAGIIGILLFIILIVMAVAVLQIVGQWKMFKKAGVEGWKSIIPIYSQVVLCQIVGVNPWWILIVFISGMLGFIPIIGSLISLAVSIYFTILLAVSTARSYGKEDAFAIGLVLAAPIFYMILGFGKSQYVGKKPMNDVVWQKAAATMNSSATAGTTVQAAAPAPQPQEGVKFCASCGTKVTTDTKYCPNCGSELK